MSQFDEIHAFINVVDYKSFTKAADILNVAKSSLSRRVNSLEKRLGVQLLQRTTRKLFLTEQGEHFYQRCSQILIQLDEAEKIVSKEQIELIGRIKIATPMVFANKVLVNLLSEFVKKNPKIELNIDLNDRQVDLLEDGFDLAIRIGTLSDSSLIAKKLAEVQIMTCASPAYLKQHGTPLHPSDLKQHKGLFYSNSPVSSLWKYNVDGKDLNCTPEKVLNANNGEFLAQTAVNGLGVLRIPTFVANEYLSRGDLVAVLQQYDAPPIGLYALFPPGRLIPARIRLLVEYLKQQFDKNTI